MGKASIRALVIMYFGKSQRFTCLVLFARCTSAQQVKGWALMQQAIPRQNKEQVIIKCQKFESKMPASLFSEMSIILSLTSERKVEAGGICYWKEDASLKGQSTLVLPFCSLNYCKMNDAWRLWTRVLILCWRGICIEQLILNCNTQRRKICS